jgi:hypothetical protein
MGFSSTAKDRCETFRSSILEFGRGERHELAGLHPEGATNAAPREGSPYPSLPSRKSAWLGVGFPYDPPLDPGRDTRIREFRKQTHKNGGDPSGTNFGEPLKGGARTPGSRPALLDQGTFRACLPAQNIRRSHSPPTRARPGSAPRPGHANLFSSFARASQETQQGGYVETKQPTYPREGRNYYRCVLLKPTRGPVWA